MTDVRLDPAYDTEGTIITFTGKSIPLLNPQPKDICILDIGHGMGYQTRFNGNGILPINLAIHCINASLYKDVPDVTKLKRLLHDAAETYLGDLVAPVKYAVGLEKYKELESVWETAIAAHFNLPNLYDAEVKQSDIAAFYKETQYMNTNAEKWKIFKGETFNTDGMLDPYQDMTLARYLFFKRYEELTGKKLGDTHATPVSELYAGNLVLNLETFDTVRILDKIESINMPTRFSTMRRDGLHTNDVVNPLALITTNDKTASAVVEHRQ